MSDVEYTWRGGFTSAEVNALHAEAFETRVFTDDECGFRPTNGGLMSLQDGEIGRAHV